MRTNTNNISFAFRSTLTGGNFVNEGSLGTNLGGESTTLSGATGLFAPGQMGMKSYTFNLTDPAFQNVTGQTVEFAFSLVSDKRNDNRRHVIDNVELVGTVTAVPEPGSLTLFGLGLLGLIGFGRRRKR